MPIYEYRCTACGEQFEILQKISDGPLRRCRSCKGKLEKLISRSSFMLRGGGWYNEGYTKSSGSKSSGSKSSGSNSSSSSTSNGKKSSGSTGSKS